MSEAPAGIPELAGVASYAGAARIGYSVDDNVRRLLRYQWTERRMMTALLSHLTAEPVWEVKCGYALHQWQDAEHVDRLRRRIGEMRHPVPPLDQAPDLALARFEGGTVLALPVQVGGTIKAPLVVPLGTRAVASRMVDIITNTLKLPVDLVNALPTEAAAGGKAPKQ